MSRRIDNPSSPTPIGSSQVYHIAIVDIATVAIATLKNMNRQAGLPTMHGANNSPNKCMYQKKHSGCLESGGLEVPGPPISDLETHTLGV